MKPTKIQIDSTYAQLAKVEEALAQTPPAAIKPSQGITNYFNTDPYYQLLEERTRIMGELIEAGEDLSKLYPDGELITYVKKRLGLIPEESKVPVRSTGLGQE